MKKIILMTIAATALSISAQAQSPKKCTVELKNPNGRILDRFTRSGNFACEDAKADCRAEKSTFPRQRISRLTCQTVAAKLPRANRGSRRVSPSPTPNRGFNKCEYSIVRSIGFGRTVETFIAPNCYSAQKKCELSLFKRQRQGRNKFASCIQTGGFTRPARVRVTRSCKVERYGRRGRLVDTHIATATGLSGTGVAADACAKAKTECFDFANHRQTCSTGIKL